MGTHPLAFPEARIGCYVPNFEVVPAGRSWPDLHTAFKKERGIRR
jgi:hypothetical protein